MAGSVQTESVRAEVAGFIKKSEEALGEASRRLTETLRDIVPGDRSSLRNVVGEAFDYMERALRGQREFANSFLDAVLRESPDKAKSSVKPAVKAPSAAKRPGAPKRPAAEKAPSAAKRPGAPKRPVSNRARPSTPAG